MHLSQRKKLKHAFHGKLSDVAYRVLSDKVVFKAPVWLTYH